MTLINHRALVTTMRQYSTVPLERLESRAPIIFFLAGAWFAGYAGLKTVRLMTEIVVPDVVSVTAGHLGLIAVAIGLLSIYPRVRTAAPRSARAGVVVSVLSGVCSIVLLVAVLHLTVSMGRLPAIPEDTARGILRPIVGVVLLLVSLFTILLGFFLFGVASVRTDSVSAPVGYLLLVPSIMWTMLFVMHATGVNGTLIGVLVYPPIAASVLSIGYRLRVETSSGYVTSLIDSPA